MMSYTGMLSRVRPAVRYILRGEIPCIAQVDVDSAPLGRPRAKPPPSDRCQESHDMDGWTWRCRNRHKYCVVRTYVTDDGEIEADRLLVCGVHLNMRLGQGWHKSPSLVPDPREPQNPRRLISV